ncbi:MAG TPA: DUF5985 family protein [Bryobacteraceae bacterium]|nr:DUF5985 family protein [Bryobacteraceae bacterium]
MAGAVYILGVLTSLACAILLLRAWGRVRMRLLLWSGLCFAGLSISNLLIFVDLVILPNVDLYVLRLGTAAVSMLLLLYGLIWDSE